MSATARYTDLRGIAAIQNRAFAQRCKFEHMSLNFASERRLHLFDGGDSAY